MLYSYTCLYCKKQFTSYEKNRKYCSWECYLSDHKEYRDHHICEQCGREFVVTAKIPSRLNKRFCSTQCRNEHNATPLPEKQINCHWCSKPFLSKVTRTGVPKRKFCSIQCRNEYNAKQKPALKKRYCKVCGKEISYNSNYCLEHTPHHRRNIWTEQEINYLVNNYSEMGAEEVSKNIDKTHIQVRDKANKLGLKISEDAVRRIVYDESSKRMKFNNPSRLPGASERMREMMKSRPDIIEKMIAGAARRQKDKPTKLEQRTAEMLDSLSVTYEQYFFIKPKFVVDFKIGGLIIQTDGDWWHGHPRYEPLRERQVKQQARDKSHDAYLTTCGFTVVRIWESDLSIELLKSILEENKDAIEKEVILDRPQ